MLPASPLWAPCSSRPPVPKALYSDMGHVGRGNIYFTWPFIKVALVLNYFGQGAWMLANSDNPQYTAMESLNPFFQMMSPNIRYLAVILSVRPA